MTFEVSRKLKEYDLDDMLENIEKSGTVESNICIYLKQDSLGISFPVLHALGDYANFEISYDY